MHYNYGSCLLQYIFLHNPRQIKAAFYTLLTWVSLIWVGIRVKGMYKQG